MKYNELLDSVMCQCVVIIEDHFKQGEYKKERIVYDLTRMALSDRQKYLIEIEDTFPSLAEQLSSYLTLCDEYFENIDSWEDEVPRGDILPAFTLICKDDPAISEELKAKFTAIDNVQLHNVYDTGSKYGIGLNHPSSYDSLYNEYLLRENRAKSIRVYSNFSAATKALLESDLRLATDEGSIVCIIDNNLDGTNRAKEIIETIAAVSGTNRKNIIGGIFSSKEKFEEINDSLYFEFSSKSSPEKLKSCIAKSAYNYFISKLQKETVGTLENAFNCAVSNKSIAYYLSRKALKEGASEYQIIMDWVKLMCSPRRENSKTIKHLITLSRVINSLEDNEEGENYPDAELEKFNTMEAFDYTVNDYLLPIMPGDVFTNSHGEWFVLIGQDCDMARRGDGSPPKNTVAELLPARICPQGDFKKWANDLEKVSICSFKQSPDTASEIFQIYYQKRKYISNEIINLCSFNSNGECCLPDTAALNPEKRKLLPNHMIDYYEQLQKYYRSVKKLKELSNDDFGTVIAHAFSPRVISFDDFEDINGQLHFDLRRVCRLTHSYVFYLYKLYLEYRGRQPFESINLVRQEELSLPVTKSSESTTLCMKFLCILSPTESKRQKMLWFIEAGEINRVIAALGFEGRITESKYLSENYEEFPLEGKKLRITKMEKKVDFRII